MENRKGERNPPKGKWQVGNMYYNYYFGFMIVVALLYITPTKSPKGRNPPEANKKVATLGLGTKDTTCSHSALRSAYPIWNDNQALISIIVEMKDPVIWLMLELWEDFNKDQAAQNSRNEMFSFLDNNCQCCLVIVVIIYLCREATAMAREDNKVK